MQSPDITKLAESLMAVQLILRPAKKDSVNPHFKKSYADLSSIWEACRDPLIQNGFSVAQLPGKDEQGNYVETLLLHTSGQWLSSKTYTIPVKNDPQAVGSAITYARRYGLAAMVGVCPEDDDAEGAMDREQSQPKQTEKPRNQQRQQNDNDL